MKKSLNFHYQAIDSNGNKTEGYISAMNHRFARAELQSKAFSGIKINRSFKLFQFKKGKVSVKEITFFFQQLSALINAGIPLLDALDLTEKNSGPHRIKMILKNIKSEIASGHSLSAVLSNHPTMFDSFIVYLIKLGEATGTLDRILKKIEQHLEKIQSIKKRIIKALIYPACTVSMSIIITTIMLVFVVPQFQIIFSRHNAPLPLMTQLVFNLSMLVRSYGWMVVLFFILCFQIFFKLKRKNKFFQTAVDQSILKIPIVKTLFLHAMLSKITQTLYIATYSGMPLLSAIELSQKITKHTSFCHALCEARQKLTEGQSLHESLSGNLFPAYLKNLIKTGERSGKLDLMLEKTALYYEESVNLLVDRLSELIEPLIMVVLGIMIGTLVIAMYLPIFNLGSVIA